MARVRVTVSVRVIEKVRVGVGVGLWRGGLLRHRREALAFAYVFPNQPSTIAWSSNVARARIFYSAVIDAYSILICSLHI